MSQPEINLLDDAFDTNDDQNPTTDANKDMIINESQELDLDAHEEDENNGFATVPEQQQDASNMTTCGCKIAKERRNFIITFVVAQVTLFMWQVIMWLPVMIGGVDYGHKETQAIVSSAYFGPFQVIIFFAFGLPSLFSRLRAFVLVYLIFHVMGSLTAFGLSMWQLSPGAIVMGILVFLQCIISMWFGIKYFLYLRRWGSREVRYARPMPKNKEEVPYAQLKKFELSVTLNRALLGIMVAKCIISIASIIWMFMVYTILGLFYISLIVGDIPLLITQIVFYFIQVSEVNLQVFLIFLGFFQGIQMATTAWTMFMAPVCSVVIVIQMLLFTGYVSTCYVIFTRRLLYIEDEVMNYTGIAFKDDEDMP